MLYHRELDSLWEAARQFFGAVRVAQIHLAMIVLAVALSPLEFQPLPAMR